MAEAGVKCFIKPRVLPKLSRKNWKDCVLKMNGGFSITKRKMMVKVKVKLEKKELSGENFKGVQCLMKPRILQRTEQNDSYFVFDTIGRR